MKNELIVGFHSVNAAIWQNPESVVEVYLNKTRKDERTDSLVEKAIAEKIKIVYVSEERLNKITPTKHQGVLAFIDKTIYKKHELTIKEIIQKSSQNDTSIIVMLDAITDPHNFGAIIRSCECFGVDAIVIPNSNSVGVNATVAKTSSGAIEYIPIITVSNLNNAIKELKDNDYWIYGTTLNDGATSLYKTSMSAKMVWILGGEGDGMGRLITENCDFHVYIPMMGKTQSLNVSVATGSILSFTNYKLNRK